ncbi:MAG TPA: LamG-like jellyroll fold domain-containing protein [Paludibacter sp.]|nr:LamG-like jellyroll fold domain-containing protein [Paludibacter sp.]
MKKSYMLGTLLMLLALVGVKAQTYSLKDLTSTEFSAGGNQYWGFERHDVNAGTYAAFTTFGNNSTAVNFYDSYITERFNYFPIMNVPESGNQFDPKRNAWFSSPGEYLYVAEEYPTGTTVGSNLTYGDHTTYPDSLMGYEVYSLHTGFNSAITYTVPATGYYRADMRVLREDLWNHIGVMKVYNFFRFGGTGTAYSMGKEFAYGQSQGIDLAQESNAAILADVLTQHIPETPVVMSGGRATRGLPTYSTSNFIYFYAHAGDKISFEADARSTGNTESSVRGAYARTKWINLAVTVSDQATASASDRFVNPYYADPAVEAQLNNALDLASQTINNLDYSASTRNSLDALYTNIDSRLTEGAIMPMEMPSLIEQLNRAIEICKASKAGLKVRYTFDNVNGSTVTDESGQGNNGTLNNASVLAMGKYHAMDLGSNKGYLDMGASVGTVVASMDDYTISAYYRIAPDAPLSGNGFFIWAFSSLQANSSSAGQYIYYQLQKQRYAFANAGWNTEKAAAVTPAAAATKGSWQHVVYTQSGTVGKLYVNGAVVAQNDAMLLPSAAFTAPPAYNWIGRPCFNNDNYLSKTLVTDFRLYNYAVPTDSISQWAARTSVYEDALTNGEVGNFTELNALISQYQSVATTVTIGSTVGMYRQTAVDSLNTAIAHSQALVTENKATQFVIDAEKYNLTQAYNVFLASINIEMNTLPEGTYRIKVNDTYFVTNPGASAVANGAAPSVANGGMLTTLANDSTQAFKFSLVNALTPPRYSIYSRNDESGVFRHITETGVYQATWGAADNDWRTYNIYFNGTDYAIRLAGAAGSTYWTWDLTNNKIVKGAGTPQYIFKLVPFVISGINDINMDGVKVSSINNAIQVTADNQVTVSVFNLTGIQIAKVAVKGTQTIPMKSGLYIVKIDGAASVVSKIMVK